MFGRLFLYQLKRTTRDRTSFFWSFFFPLILGTMFALSFGKIMNDGDILEKIPVSIIRGDGEAVAAFNQIAASVDFLDIQKVEDEEDALHKLETGDIYGVIYADDTLSLTIREEGLEASILKTFLDECLQYTDVFATLLAQHPEKIQEIVAQSNEAAADTQYTKNKVLGKNISSYAQFFYALFAMCLLFGCFSGVTCASSLQADASAIGARRNVSAAGKQTMLLADFLACIVIQVLSALVLLFYLTALMKIDFGNDYLHILLIIIAGSLIGVASGVFIGSFKCSPNAKIALVLTFSMFSCFLSGLMAVNIKFTLDTYAPIVNKINPATLITNCFYALNALDSMDMYWSNITVLLLEAFIFCAASYFMTRRLKYASI